jgi:Spy/CpxP family protein refolding chaperone
MKKRGMLMAAALLLAAGPALAQAPAPRDWGEHAMSPMTMILEHRAELELTDDQVARLEAIGTQLRERTAPLRERMREAMADMPVPGAHAEHGARSEGAPRERRAPRAMTPEQREAIHSRMTELRPVREEIRAIRLQARDDARAVLTADQQQKLRELMQAHRGHRGPRGRPMGEAHHRDGGGRG